MKIRGILIVAAFGFFSAGAFAQVYTYTWSGALTGCGSEIDLSIPEGNGGYSATAESMTDTITYNAATQMITQSGTVTFSPASAAIPMTGPAYLGEGNETLGNETLTINNGGVVSFDTTSSLNVGSFDWEIQIPVSATGTLEGQAFSGNYFMDLSLAGSVSSVSPTAISFAQFADPGGAGGRPTGIDVAGYDLDNGTSDDTYRYYWDQTVTAVAAVPEPGTFSLLSLGLSALAFRFQRKTGK